MSSMTTDDSFRPARRGRSEQKRAAILDAATALFLADGYERTSGDAVAARAGVSKRTVYDHFGGKERLFTAVLAEVAAGVLDTLRRGVAEELPPRCDPGPALLAFVRRVATETFDSSEYVLYRRLAAAAGSLPTPVVQPDDPIELLVARIAQFGREGVLRVVKPRRATEHFAALTLLVALDALERGDGPAVVDEILVDGVDAFLRAYRVQGTPTR
jgi:TetR/AcrR family transcriptional repressor of mexJK operon